jgi:hypothetical protein
MEIQQTSFEMTILFRHSSYRNYLLIYMCINFLGNRPHADGEWQKLHSHACTRVTVCSFVSALLITWFTWGDGLQRRYASDVAFCIVHFPLTVDNGDMN